MWTNTATTMIDPLAAFMARATRDEGRHPMPLVSSHWDVQLCGGLAIVSSSRLFRNVEAEAIEAVLTFPIPVHATLFSLEAEIDGRRLRANAQACSQARATYERAVERGKMAALHEEILRGIHMLSIANIRAGGEVVVALGWAMPLTRIGDELHLRIPLTVGEVYGRSGLSETDDLLGGGSGATGTLTVRGMVDGVRLGSAVLVPEEGVLSATIPLDRPIDLRMPCPDAEGMPPLHGIAADGRAVSLALSPALAGDGRLDVAILLDRSGSMATQCVVGGRELTQHQVAAAGIASLGTLVRDGDRIALWQFSGDADFIGSVGAAQDSGGGGSAARLAHTLQRLTECLMPPSGGTEIGGAIAVVDRHGPVRDIILLTDGKSHALDVQALARSGRRISVILIGEDSLDAKVGHLAALTGGNLFAVAGEDVAPALATAFSAARRMAEGLGQQALPLREINLCRNGLQIAARWEDDTVTEMADSLQARAVAAVAAGLALPALDSAEAEMLAEAEGLVSHLTSLVLVDEAGAERQGLPAFRKIALPAPPSSMGILFERADSGAGASRRRRGPEIRSTSASRADRSSSLFKWLSNIITRRSVAPASPGSPLLDMLARVAGDSALVAIGRQIDWRRDGRRAMAGDLSVMADGGQAFIEACTGQTMDDLVARLRCSRDELALLLLALGQAGSDESARRVASNMLARLMQLSRQEISDLLALVARRSVSRPWLARSRP